MSDLKKQDVAELKKALSDKREGLRAFRFGAEGSRSRNVREGRTLRKEIAQIMTELRAREIASEKKTA
jgi:ribosomal protein L29